MIGTMILSRAKKNFPEAKKVEITIMPDKSNTFVVDGEKIELQREPEEIAQSIELLSSAVPGEYKGARLVLDYVTKKVSVYTYYICSETGKQKFKDIHF